MQWIFRELHCDLKSGNIYAIRGFNGSGKSTLLRILSTMESPNEGERHYQLGNVSLPEHAVAQHLSFSAPYMSIPTHLTVYEMIEFHRAFKTMTMDTPALLADIGLRASSQKTIQNLSSGQCQKIKLALALCNDAPLLLLDEPSTNLDELNYEWFVNKMSEIDRKKLICIATNDARDVQLCNQEIQLEDFK